MTVHDAGPQGAETRSSAVSRRTGKTNRGPSAGPANRQALIDAARIEFVTDGAAVPLSRIARRAGVGQGSLYRHFRDRVELAAAVFEANLKEISRATKASGRPFCALFDLIEEQASEASAMIEVVSTCGPRPETTALREQLRGILAEVSRSAHEAGESKDQVESDDLLTAVSMLALTVAKAPPEMRRETTVRARRILEAWFLA